MFDSRDAGIELWPGESHDEIVASDEAAYQLTCRLVAEDIEAEDRHVLPGDLESIPTGPYLAVIVGSVDRARLNGQDAVKLMCAEARLASSFEAGKLASMVEVALSPPGNSDSGVERDESAVEYAACEIAPALRLTRRSAESELGDAFALHDRLSRVGEIFSSGVIDRRRVKVMISLLAHLSQETVDEVLDRILDQAGELTAGELRARVSRLVMEADPEGVDSAMEEGLKERRVVSYPNPDFTGTLSIQGADPYRIHRAMDFIDNLARSMKVEGETRTLDEIRADAALDLLTGECVCHDTPQTKGRTVLRVDLATLTGLSDAPGDLAGYAPVVADIARKAAVHLVNGEWVYEVTDNGRVVATGTTARRPKVGQRRHLAAVYDTCVFPGCRRPAYQCDLDHRKPSSQGGPTHNDNLGPLCRHHHMMRHHAPWRLMRLPDGGHQWISPLGHSYVRKRAPPS